MDIITAQQEKVEQLTDKHWEECRQIALYDDELKKAMALLGKVKKVHAAAIRNGDAAVSSITSRLLHEIEMLEKEIAASEQYCPHCGAKMDGGSE